MLRKPADRFARGVLVAVLSCVLLMMGVLFGCNTNAVTQDEPVDSDTTAVQDTPGPQAGSLGTTPSPSTTMTADKPSYAGKYIIVSMEMDGIYYEGESLELALEDNGGVRENYIEITDSTHMTLKLNGLTAPMTYTLSGKVLIARDVNQAVFEFTLEGDTITVVFADRLLGYGNGYMAEFSKQ